MNIFCTECGKHIDVSLEELENQNGHLVCPQCLAEIDVDSNLFNGKDTVMPNSNENDTTSSQQTSSYTKPPALPSAPPSVATPQAEQPPAGNSPSRQPHIDDVMRYCKHCGAFLREGVNFCPKCGKYVRVSPPPPSSPHLTPAQQQAAKLRANTPPANHVPANKQSTYKPPQQPTYQNAVRHQRNPINSVRNDARRRTSTISSTGKKGTWLSKFDFLSLGGCLTITLITVALFFIIYIIIGVTSE